MKKLKTSFCCIIIEFMIIICVALANRYPKPLFYFFFYNVLYGIVLSFLFPLFMLYKEKNKLYSMGLKPSDCSLRRSDSVEGSSCWSDTSYHDNIF